MPIIPSSSKLPQFNNHREIPSLSYLSNRVVCLKIFQANVRWRSLKDVVVDLKFQLRQWQIPNNVKNGIFDGLTETFRELQRWTEKHSQMFPETTSKITARRRQAGLVAVHRGEHLRLFYDHLVWSQKGYNIDDLQTAYAIAKISCHDWPQMKFQFACCYAMTDLLYNDYLFDKIRRKCFRKQLDDHPVYDFWLKVLDNSTEWKRLFRDDRMIVDQRVVLVFQFAMVNGFIELLKHLWDKLTHPQQESIGFLWWKKVCFNAKHKEVMHFLCHHLCEINLQGMARITWDSFYHKVYLSTQGDELCASDQNENLRQLECLLENFCPNLRAAMLKKENFRVITDTFLYNKPEAFALLLDYLDRQQLKVAREHVDRFYDKRRTTKFTNLRNTFIHRQMTID
uniref:Uncharacterized protein n=1 Tax=Panagrolaimus superbus TaxID=310955 RepID=A0A914YAF6_9BILA